MLQIPCPTRSLKSDHIYSLATWPVAWSDLAGALGHADDYVALLLQLALDVLHELVLREVHLRDQADVHHPCIRFNCQIYSAGPYN